MSDEKRSGVQKLYTGLVSPSRAAAMEAESRTWMVKCPNCGYERSVWDTGGVRYKAAGTARQLRRCSNCGKMGWHLIYKPQGVSPASVAASTLPTVATAGSGRRWMLWALVIGVPLVAVAVFLLLLFLLINSFTQPVATAGDNFMTALKAGNYEQGYALCTPDLQKQIGSVSALATLVRNYQPTTWNWTSRSIRNGVGVLDGNLTYTIGKKGTAHLELQQIDSDWRIVSFRMNPN